MKKKIYKTPLFCFVTGRSGGHLIPCLTLAKKIQHQNPDAHIILFSTRTNLDKKILEGQGIHTYKMFNVEQVPYKKWYRYPSFGCALLFTFFSSFIFFMKNRPQKIISTGGYIAIPVCLAATLLRIPTELYELNAIPGRTIQFLAPFAQKIHLVFHESLSFFNAKQCIPDRYPIRFEKRDKNISQEEELKKLEDEIDLE